MIDLAILVLHEICIIKIGLQGSWRNYWKWKILEHSDSLFSSPGSLQICVDVRKLNRVTILDSELFPCPEDLFARLSGAKCFSKTDLARSYRKILLETSSKRYAAFSSKEWHFQWNYLWFGKAGAQMTSTQLIKKLRVDRQDIGSYLGIYWYFMSHWRNTNTDCNQYCKEWVWSY